ncbi:hypothetical protein V6N11_058424 [Hibiscus sabdariffa]|uniref:Uncharacterized protein n=1 Tax=Hibiscus sabdariffa TaxID=183260 RepID=A0ABR2U4Z4_9ROSI
MHIKWRHIFEYLNFISNQCRGISTLGAILHASFEQSDRQSSAAGASYACYLQLFARPSVVGCFFATSIVALQLSLGHLSGAWSASKGVTPRTG